MIDPAVHKGSALAPLLEAFVEVARLRSVRRAAEILHIGQPAASARIAALEQVVGAPLFERSRRGMTLTPAGQALLPHVERSLDSLLLGLQRARDVKLADSREVVLGAAAAVSAYVLPELIARLRKSRPDLRTLVRTGHSEEMVALVAGGEIDLGLIRDLRDPRVVARPLYQEDLTLVVRQDHPFAYDGRVTVGRLRESVLILFDRTSSYYESTYALFRVAGVVPAGTIEVDNIETAKRMTLRGLGVSFLPSTAVADSLADGSLVSVRVMGVGTIRRTVMAVRRLSQPHELPRELIDLLRDVPQFVPGARPIQFEE